MYVEFVFIAMQCHAMAHIESRICVVLAFVHIKRSLFALYTTRVVFHNNILWSGLRLLRLFEPYAFPSTWVDFRSWLPVGVQGRLPGRAGPLRDTCS